jgi:hypothetical protein
VEVDETTKVVQIPDAAALRFNWLSTSGPAFQASAFHTIAENRRYEIDHYEINKIWQALPFVLEGREIGDDYVPPGQIHFKPYPGKAELIDELENDLGPMELTLAIQYLYALFSLRDPSEAPTDRWPTLADDLKAVRQIVLMVAVGEMAHLRLVNRMLMLLKGDAYQPVVRWSTKQLKRVRNTPELRRLDPTTLAKFIEIERPNGKIDTAYHQCIATLEQDGDDYPKQVLDIAMRIDGDGTDHFHRFVNAYHILNAYGDPEVYLRPVKVTSGTQTDPAMDLFRQILASITQAYAAEAAGNDGLSQTHVAAARQTMLDFRDEAERVAALGFGLPLL